MATLFGSSGTGVHVRERSKKCLLLGLSFALLLTNLFIAQPASASWNPIPTAWNDCPAGWNDTKYTLESGKTRKSWTQAFYERDAAAYNEFRNADYSIILWRNDYLQVKWSKNASGMQFYRTGTGPNQYNMRFQWSSGVSTNEYRTWGTTNNLQPDDDQLVGSASVNTTSGTSVRQDLYNEDRVCAAKGLTYDSTFPSGNQLPVAEVDAPAGNPTKGCKAIDLGCWVGKIFDGVIDGFQSLAEGLLAGITFLFVPDGDVASITFNDLKDFLTEKLGFLMYPFDFMLDFYDGVVTGIETDQAWGTGVCGGGADAPAIEGISNTTFFGTQFKMEWCSVPSFIKTAVGWFLRISLALACFYLFERRLHEVMGHKEEE